VPASITIALSLSDPPTQVIGVEDVRYTNQETAALTEVNFAVFAEILGGSITLGNVRVDGQAINPRQTPGFLAIPSPDRCSRASRS